MLAFGAAACALLMASVTAAQLRADLKIRIQETYGTTASSRTEYYTRIASGAVSWTPRVTW